MALTVVRFQRDVSVLLDAKEQQHVGGGTATGRKATCQHLPNT